MGNKVQFFPVADPRGEAPARAPQQMFLQFLGKFVCWRLRLKGWRPLLREILDPPLPSSDNSY